MPQMIRKKIKWATKRRKCGSRVWKTKWVMVAQQTPKAPRGEKPEKAQEKKGWYCKGTHSIRGRIASVARDIPPILNAGALFIDRYADWYRRVLNEHVERSIAAQGTRDTSSEAAPR